MAKAPKLTDPQVEERLTALPDWSLVNDAIQRTYQFKGFMDAVGFVNKVAALAEKADHHPDILIRWNKVTLTLSTHDSGGITQKDFDLAKRSDAAAV